MNPSAKQINYWTAQKETRPEKIEEIKAVWDSPKFKTNNQRLVFLLRHCKNVEYGYTLREFGHAIFSDHWSGYLALKNIHQMFTRFRKDAENHEVILLSRFMKVKGIGRWYYYNMIEDEEGFKGYKLRMAKIVLAEEKNLAKMQDILDMSQEERERKEREFEEKLKTRHLKRLERKKAKKSNP